MKRWRELCKLPLVWPNRPLWEKQIALLLDIAEEMYPVPNTGDKYSDLSNWLRSIPLTEEENDRARLLIANRIA